MKKIIVLLFILWQLTSFADNCIPSFTTITITRQAELDSFPINYPNCTRVEGSLNIIGSDIVNLNGLKDLEYISTIRVEYCDNLIDFTGLIKVEQIIFFEISHNSSLINFNGLNAIKYIGNLSVNNCNSLLNFQGLEILKETSSIYINYNKKLLSLDGLQNIDTMQNMQIVGNNNLVEFGIHFTKIKNMMSLNISDNHYLKSIAGFDSLKTIIFLVFGSLLSLENFYGFYNLDIIHDLSIASCNSLQNFKGLESVTKINNLRINGNYEINNFVGFDNLKYTFSFNVYGNKKLENFIGMPKLIFIDNFDIERNDRLINFEGLEKIAKLNQHCYITNNDKLTSFYGLHNVTKFGGSLYIENNDQITNFSGLNNVDTIEGLNASINLNLIDFIGLDKLIYCSGLTVYGNTALKTFKGLEALKGFGGDLQIFRNPCLASINELNQNIVWTGSTYLSFIQNNPNLNCCKVVDNILQNNPNITVNISNNAPDCSSLTAIQNAPNNCVPNLNYCCYNQFVTQYDTICKGDTYILPSGKVVSTAGMYQDTFPIGNCDSFITTYLTVVQGSLTHQAISLCTGDAFVLNSGQSITTNGTYNDTIWHFNNCDSIIQYQISFGNAINPNPINISICHGSTYTLYNGQTISQAGTYQDTIKNGSTKGCDSIFTIQLSIQPIIQQTVNATFCSGTSYKLPSGNTTNLAGTYYDTIKTALGCDSLIITKLTMVGLQTKSQTVNLCQGQALQINNHSYTTSGQYIDTIKSSSACDTVLTTNLTIHAYPIVSLGADQTICQGNVITLNAGNSTANIVWNTGSTNSSIQVNTAGTYIASVTANNCTTKDTVNIKVEDLFFVDLGADKGLCPEQTIELIVNKSDAQYLWQDGSSNQNYIVNDTGVYHVKVTTNCNTSSDTVNIYGTICDCEFQIPNAFTPNQDGINDLFGVVNDCGNVANFQLQVFNRWGELLFDTNNEQSKWNGNYKGENQPVDDYIFVLQYTQNGNAYFKKGTFSLLK